MIGFFMDIIFLVNLRIASLIKHTFVTGKLAWNSEFILNYGII